MDLHQLRAFVAVAETRSFSIAAKQLFLTQPAVSKRLSQLESQLGIKLLNRLGRQTHLTPAGNALLSRAKHILQEMEDGIRLITNLREDMGGRLSFATSHHIGLHRLPPVLRQFSQQFPQIELDIHFMDSEMAYDKLKQGELEFALVTLAPHTIPKLQTTPLWRDELCICTAPDHALARSKSPQLEHLYEYATILPGTNTYTRQIIDKILWIKNREFQLKFTTNYLETIKMMVSVGLAWSVLPLTMVDQSIKVCAIKSLRLDRTLGCVFHRQKTLSNAGKMFIGLLTATISI